MSIPTVRIHDLETDQTIDREMTADEFIAYTTTQDAIAAAAAAKVAADALQATKLADVNAKLALLGLTTDDLTTLGVGFKAL